jgi:hypothetical protein
MGSERIGMRIAAMAAELQELLGETLIRGRAVVGHRLVAGMAEAPVAELGESSLAGALSTLLRISKNEAGRRVHEARDLGPRRTTTAEVLAPLLDQDGDLTDADRARRRYLILGKQQCDGLSELRGMLDPQARAVPPRHRPSPRQQIPPPRARPTTRRRKRRRKRPVSITSLPSA